MVHSKGDDIPNHRVRDLQLLERMRRWCRVRQEHAILLQQGFVDGGRPESARDHVGGHVGQHERQHEPVASRHLEDDQHRGDRRSDDAGKDRAHPDESKRPQLTALVAQQKHVEMPDRASEHGAHEERRGEDAASTAARVREDRRDELDDAEGDEDAKAQLTRERMPQGLIAAARDAGRPEEAKHDDREDPGYEPADPGMHPRRHAPHATKPQPQLEEAVREGDRNEGGGDAKDCEERERRWMIQAVGLIGLDHRVDPGILSITAARAAAMTTPDKTA
ncbi:MAG: hypothetical protein IPG96_07890 [Proteobacteria bacterium]|nr:hypothetical protein [Pseudomonadota bacterium]